MTSPEFGQRRTQRLDAIRAEPPLHPSHSRRQRRLCSQTVSIFRACCDRSICSTKDLPGDVRTKITQGDDKRWFYIFALFISRWSFWACVLAHEHKHYFTVSSPVLSPHLKWQTEKTIDKATKMIKQFLLYSMAGCDKCYEYVGPSECSPEKDCWVSMPLPSNRRSSRRRGNVILFILC